MVLHRLSDTIKLIISILLCELTGILSAIISNSGLTSWFVTLQKPSWNPPSQVFGPVWTILYLLMGISLWLIWKNPLPEKQKQKAYIVFAIQLFLNFWWSIIFFYFQSPGLAFFEIISLLGMIALSIYCFKPISKVAAYLLISYLLWVSFATFLNYSIWMLN